MTDTLRAASVVARVTFFEDRAEVVRVAKLRVDAGITRVEVPALSPFLDDRSVRASASGARVVSARAHVAVRDPESASAEAVERLVAEADLADRDARAADKSIDRAERMAQRARSLFRAWVEGASIVPRDASGDEGKARWERALARVDEAARAGLARAAEARRARADAQARADRARARLAEARVAAPVFEGVATIEIDASKETEVEIELKYRVACALWRPEHVVRSGVVGADGHGAIELVSYATAWQRTGERWDRVEARFSTARPGRDASAPLLTDDVLALRRRADPKHVDVSARDRAIATAGVDRGARAVDEMPGVDDGGEPLTFAAKELLTIDSDGRPARVEIAAATVDATIERVAYPELANAAHLRATATLSGRPPLLAGPVRIVRDRSLVGHGRVKFVGTGEPFEIGLGLDDGLRVKRELVAERDTTAVLGTQKLKRRVSVFVSNLSGSSRRLVLVERVPVSEIESVEVKLLDASGWTIDDEGIARRAIDVAPRSTRAVELVYEVRAASNVTISF